MFISLQRNKKNVFVSDQAMSEMIKLKLKRSELGKDRQEWSCESPTNSPSSEHAVKRKCIGGKRKYIKNINSSKNRKCAVARKKRIKKCISQLSKSVSSEPIKIDPENISEGNLAMNEIAPNPFVRSDDQNSCREIEDDLKAKLKEDSKENVVERGADSPSTIDCQSFETKFSCGIEDISEASSDSDTVSDRSFPRTSYANVKNTNCDIGDGKYRTIRMSSPVCVQGGNSGINSWNFLNPRASIHGNNYYRTHSAINYNRSESSYCNFIRTNLDLMREQNNSCENELNDERVLQEISDKNDNKPASSSKRSEFTMPINQFSADNIHKNVGAFSTSTPVPIGRYFPSNYDPAIVHANMLRSAFDGTASSAFPLPLNNPYVPIRDSSGRVFYNAGSVIYRPIPVHLKENEIVNFTPERTKRLAVGPPKIPRIDRIWQDNLSVPYGSTSTTGTGSSSPSVAAKRPVKSPRKRHVKILKNPTRDFTAKPATDLQTLEGMHTQPGVGLDKTRSSSANQNPTNTLNNPALRPDGLANLGGNPRFEHPFYSPINHLQRMIGPSTGSHLSLPGRHLVDTSASNTHVDLARLQNTRAQSNLVDSNVNRQLDGLEQFHNSMENKEKVFGCYICCNFWTDSLHNLIKHATMDRSHPDDSVLLNGAQSSCLQCNFETSVKLEMEVHCTSKQHKEKVARCNHLKEGGLKSTFRKRDFPEVCGTMCLGCNVCLCYADNIDSFRRHCTELKHNYNVKFKKFLDSFETKKEYYFCKSCNIGVMSKELLFMHSTSNAHKAAEHRLSAACGARNLGGICIVKETYLNVESVANMETKKVSKTDSSLNVKAKKTNKRSRSLHHQNDPRTWKVPTNVHNKDFNPPSNVEQGTAFCLHCNLSFSDPSDFVVHIKECHGTGENSAKLSVDEKVSENQFSSEKKIIETVKDMNTACDANIATNIPEAECFPERNMSVSRLNSITGNSEETIDFSKETKSNLDNTMDMTVENLRRKCNTLESESVNSIQSTSKQNKDEDFEPLSTQNNYTSSDSDSSEIKVD